MTMCSAYTSHAIHLYAKRVTRIECLERWMKVFFPVCFLLGFRVLPPCLGLGNVRGMWDVSGFRFRVPWLSWRCMDDFQPGNVTSMYVRYCFRRIAAYRKRVSYVSHGMVWYGMVLLSTLSFVSAICPLCGLVRCSTPSFVSATFPLCMVWYGVRRSDLHRERILNLWYGMVNDAQFCADSVFSMHGMVCCSTFSFTPRTTQCMVYVVVFVVQICTDNVYSTYGILVEFWRSILYRQRVLSGWRGMVFDAQFRADNVSSMCFMVWCSTLFGIDNVYSTSGMAWFSTLSYRVPTTCPQHMVRYGLWHSFVPTTFPRCMVWCGVVWYGMVMVWYNFRHTVLYPKCILNVRHRRSVLYGRCLLNVLHGMVFDTQFCTDNVSSMYGTEWFSTHRFVPTTTCPHRMIWYGFQMLSTDNVYSMHGMVWFSTLIFDNVSSMYGTTFCTENVSSTHDTSYVFRHPVLSRQLVLNVWYGMILDAQFSYRQRVRHSFKMNSCRIKQKGNPSTPKK